MEKLTIKALILAAAAIAPNLASPALEMLPIKEAETLSKDELRQTLRAQNCAVFKPQVIEDTFEEHS